MGLYGNSLGKWGEDLACSYLLKNGYIILQRNYRCRFGEIDIIANKSSELIFIEVKTRTSIEYGYPSEAITYKKQMRYNKLAMCYLKETGRKSVSCRFDIIEVLVNRNKNTIFINHIQDAFQASGAYY